jgi:hypothetical protein
MKPTPDADPVTAAAARVHAELLNEHGRSPEVRVLVDMAATCWVRAEQARALVEAEGLTITNRRGTFAHPAAAIERAARAGFLSVIRTLRARPARLKTGRLTHSERLAASARPLSPAGRTFFDVAATPAEQRRARLAKKYMDPSA